MRRGILRVSTEPLHRDSGWCGPWCRAVVLELGCSVVPHARLQRTCAHITPDVRLSSGALQTRVLSEVRLSWRARNPEHVVISRAFINEAAKLPAGPRPTLARQKLAQKYGPCDHMRVMYDIVNVSNDKMALIKIAVHA